MPTLFFSLGKQRIVMRMYSEFELSTVNSGPKQVPNATDQIRTMRAKIAALNECVGMCEEKEKRGEPWPPSAPIGDPKGYHVHIELGEEAAKGFGWRKSIDVINDTILELQARIEGLAKRRGRQG